MADDFTLGVQAAELSRMILETGRIWAFVHSKIPKGVTVQLPGDYPVGDLAAVDPSPYFEAAAQYHAPDWQVMVISALGREPSIVMQQYLGGQPGQLKNFRLTRDEAAEMLARRMARRDNHDPDLVVAIGYPAMKVAGVDVIPADHARPLWHAYSEAAHFAITAGVDVGLFRFNA